MKEKELLRLMREIVLLILYGTTKRSKLQMLNLSENRLNSISGLGVLSGLISLNLGESEEGPFFPNPDKFRRMSSFSDERFLF
jgi:hypothetical protein